MTKFLFLFFFSFFSITICSHSPEVFKIDLDLPPEERFREVILSKHQQIKSFANTFLLNLPSSFLTQLRSVERVVSQKHKEFYSELQGVAKYANISFEEAYAFNLIYELLSSCTSIVSIDKNGNIIHGRNLDYPYGSLLSTFLVRYEFYRNGSLIFEGDGNAGFLGLATGMKRGAFAVSLNQRDSTANKGEPSLDMVIKLPVPYIIRKVLEMAKNYEDAVEMLSKEKFASNAYLIVSGIDINEGVVLTRSKNSLVNSSRIDENNEEWFVVQTNYDRDIEDPASDPRRVTAEGRMREIGRENIDMRRMFNEVLSVNPNKNSITITSGVMCAKTGDFNTTIWED